MHEKRFVENIAVKLAILGFLNGNLRGLRQAGQQLVNRVRGKHHGVGTARTIFADGMHVFIVVVKGSVRNPGFIKMQGINFRAQLFFNHFHVVAYAVVCALRNRQNARTLVLHMTRERIGLDLGAD